MKTRGEDTGGKIWEEKYGRKNNMKEETYEEAVATLWVRWYSVKVVRYQVSGVSVKDVIF